MCRCVGVLALLIGLAGSPLTGSAKEVCGSVRSVDAANGTITVSVLGEKEPLTYSLLKRDVPVVDTLGQELKVTDLRQAHRVALALDEAQDYVVGIRLDRDCRWGVLEEVARDGDAIVARFFYVRQKIPVGRDVAVVVGDGKQGRLSDLKPGYWIRLTYAPDQSRLLQVLQGKQAYTGNPYTRNPPHGGLLLKVDRPGKTLEILDLSERARPQQFHYENWVPVRLVFSTHVLRQADVDALWTYARVSINYEADLRRVVAVSAEVPKLLRRTVAKIDREGRKLTLNVEEGQTEEFLIPADVKVLHEYESNPVALDRVTEGAIVTVGLSPDGREVLAIQVFDR